MDRDFEQENRQLLDAMRDVLAILVPEGKVVLPQDDLRRWCQGYRREVAKFRSEYDALVLQYDNLCDDMATLARSIERRQASKAQRAKRAK